MLESNPPLGRTTRHALWLAALLALLPVAAQAQGRAPDYPVGSTSSGPPTAPTQAVDAREVGSTMGAAGGGSGTRDSSWWMPGGGRTAIGLNLGRSTFHVGCGTGGFPCDDTDRYVSLYGRNMANDLWGGELGLVHMGTMNRGGGDTRAYGLNLSLVGRAPIASPFGVFGKVGALYGHTSTDAAVGSGLSGGTKNGFGLSLGAGVSWDFTPNLSAVLEWDRYDFRFAGTGRDAVHATSVGLQYRY